MLLSIKQFWRSLFFKLVEFSPTDDKYLRFYCLTRYAEEKWQKLGLTFLWAEEFKAFSSEWKLGVKQTAETLAGGCEICKTGELKLFLRAKKMMWKGLSSFAEGVLKGLG